MDRKEGFDGIGEDLFFLSNGHIQFYSVLARSGYFPVSELSYFPSYQ
jgi:transketolase